MAWNDVTLDAYANNGPLLNRGWRDTTLDAYANNGPLLNRGWRDTTLAAYANNISLTLAEGGIGFEQPTPDIRTTQVVPVGEGGIQFGQPTPLMGDENDQELIVVGGDGIRFGGPGPFIGLDQTFHFETATVDVYALPAILGIGTKPEPVPHPTLGSGWKVKIVDRFGNPIVEPGAKMFKVDDIGWGLNEVTDASFKIHKSDPAVKTIERIVHEAQLYLNGHLMCWGPTVTKETGSDDPWMTYSVQNPDWFPEKRRIGMQPNPPLIPNGGFDNGLTGWGYSQGYGRVRAVSSPRFTGTGAARITWSGNGQITPRLYRGHNLNSPFQGAWTAQVWVYLGSNVVLSDPEEDTPLLILESWNNGKLKQKHTATLPSDVPRNAWFMLEVSVSTWAGPSRLFMILEGIPGDVFFDHASIRQSGAFAVGRLGEDIVTTCRILIWDTQQKSDFNLSTAAGLSGIQWPGAQWPYETHTRYSQMLDAARSYGGGFDASIELTPTTRTWTPHPNGQGVKRPIMLKLGRPEDGGSVVGYTMGSDGSGFASIAMVEVTMPQGGKLFDQFNAESWFDGIHLHEVAQADEGTPPHDVVGLSERYAHETTIVGDDMSVTVHNDIHDFVFDSGVGDRFDVNIVDEEYVVTGEWRVITKQISGDSLLVTLKMVRVS